MNQPGRHRAACAACLQPIVTRDQLVVSGTEVLHRSCARAGITTELARTRQALADLRHDRANLQNLANDALRTADRATQAAERQVAEIDARIRSLENVAAARAANAQRDLAQAVRERDEARRERDEARSRLPPPAPATTATQIPTATPESSTREEDPARVRFALLDLD